jgi:hypothetical protein
MQLAYWLSVLSYEGHSKNNAQHLKKNEFLSAQMQLRDLTV